MANSNFFFLTNEWSEIYDSAQKAERNIFSEPIYAAILCRKSLEKMLSWLYDHDSNLELPNKDQFTLNDLIWEKTFQKSWGLQFGKDLSYIKSKGNDAAHKTLTIEANESLACVKYLYRFCSAIVRNFSENPPA